MSNIRCDIIVNAKMIETLPHIGGEFKNRAWNLIHGKPESRLVLQFATNTTLSEFACFASEKITRKTSSQLMHGKVKCK